MKYILSAILIFLSITSGCLNSNNSKNGIIKSKFLDYFLTGVFDKDLIKSLYTDSTDSNQSYEIYYPNSIHLIGYSGIIIERKFIDDDFIKLEQQLNKTKVKSTLLKDSINYFVLSNKSVDEVKSINRIPIPDFEASVIDFNIDENSELIEIKRQKGYFFSNKFDIDLKRDQQLKKYVLMVENGLSSSFIIDHKNRRIVYWVMVW